MSSMPLPVPEPLDDDFAWDLSLEFADDTEMDLLLPPDTSFEDQLALDDLLDQGFAWEEGLRLVIFRSHLYENREILERLAADPHMQFARWLYERGSLSR